MIKIHTYTLHWFLWIKGCQGDSLCARSHKLEDKAHTCRKPEKEHRRHFLWEHIHFTASRRPKHQFHESRGGGSHCGMGRNVKALAGQRNQLYITLLYKVWCSLNIFHVDMKYVNQSVCYSDFHLPFIIFFQIKKYDTYTEKYPSLA